MMVQITGQDIQNLLVYFSKNTYKAKDEDEVSKAVMHKVADLLKSDYGFVVVSNSNGELSTHYPSQLVILEHELCHDQNVNIGHNSSAQRSTTSIIYESSYDVTKLRELISKSRFARCRARFPVPVILYKGKCICRSSTLSGGPEIYGRSGLDYLFYGSDNSTETCDNNADTSTNSQSDWQLFDRVRSQDIKLLKTFNVGTIIDFMVEKKKVKFGMNVTSSEKVDKENRYSDFSIISLPYPGCEFFKEYRDNNYTAQGLVFDWSQAHVDASIGVPEDSVIEQLSIDWNMYKGWDLVKITQNYMKLLLKYLHDNSSGLLIHCISGWDRTPLFVSLLRLSLWADGLAHQSLNSHQILYLTIAYDWMLFGHHLSDRLSKGEDIMFFCFSMLKHLTDEEFSLLSPSSKIKSNKMGERMSEKSFKRTDSDSQLDILSEHDECGSNISLNSSCSSISTKSQEQPMTCIFLPDECVNGNPTFPSEVGNPMVYSSHSRHTSPVSVPLASRLRQRQESSSSLSTGSWQMVTGTGSLRGSDSTTSSSTADSNGTNANREQHLMHDLTTTDNAYNDSLTLRKERLLNLRSIFCTCYCTTIGIKFKNNADSSLGAIFGNLAEKVGF